jgi:hypothetical protein
MRDALKARRRNRYPTAAVLLSVFLVLDMGQVAAQAELVPGRRRRWWRPACRIPSAWTAAWTKPPGWPSRRSAAMMTCPIFGAEPSEKTEFRIAYDDDYLYVSGVLHDRAPTVSGPHRSAGTTAASPTTGSR